jgi:drug/metabolite transporter (DMT)-like permease
MDKKTGMIVSIVGSVICLCLAISCCGGGIYGGIGVSDSPNWLYLIGGICLGLLPIIVAVLLWVFLYGRAKDEGVEAGPQMDL